jgi:hypothetical protein
MEDLSIVVTCAETELGSYVQPPSDGGWTQRQKVAWHAAVCAVDTGLQIKVFASEDRKSTFVPQGEGRAWIMQLLNYQDASEALLHIGMGAHAYADQKEGYRIRWQRDDAQS